MGAKRPPTRSGVEVMSPMSAGCSGTGVKCSVQEAPDHQRSAPDPAGSRYQPAAGPPAIVTGTVSDTELPFAGISLSLKRRERSSRAPFSGLGQPRPTVTNCCLAERRRPLVTFQAGDMTRGWATQPVMSATVAPEAAMRPSASTNALKPASPAPIATRPPTIETSAKTGQVVELPSGVIVPRSSAESAAGRSSISISRPRAVASASTRARPVRAVTWVSPLPERIEG